AASETAEKDAETRLYAVWALGAIHDPSSLAELVRLASTEDAGLRKAAVFALGSYPQAEATAPLVAALRDEVEDGRWNAALGLARRRDERATPTLLLMMDRAHLAGVSGLTADQRDEVMLQAVQAAAVVPQADLRAALESLRDHDPSLKVRAAARKAL